MKTQIEKENIDRILVPIDFSDYSVNASYFALHLASRTGAEIRLFHAFFNPMTDPMTFPDTFTYQSNLSEIFIELEKNAKKEMEKFYRKMIRYSKIKKLQKLKIKTELTSGQPADEIGKVIGSFSPGLIITGTRGHGEKADELLGSVAARVIDTSGIPVLLVTRDATLDADKEMKVLYATNFDDSDYRAIRSLWALLSDFHVTIRCVHFSPDESKSLANEKMAEMKKYFTENYPEIELQCNVIASENILSGLDRFVEDNDIELIALTHKKRNLIYRLFNPSLAKKLLFQTKRPVFVFN